MRGDAILGARRTENIRYAVRDIVLVAREAARAGRELAFLNIGDPCQFDFATPPHIIEAICKALRDGHTRYAPSEGLPEALEAIREHAEGHYGIREIRDVFTGTGCSECIEVALAALADAGEEVLVPAPGYPLYSALLCKLGCREVPYALDESNDWQPDLDDIAAKITPRTRALVVINPNNPTGSVCSRATLEGLADLADRHGLVLFADEIYSRLVLDGRSHVALASLRDDVPIVTFNGLAKSYLAPGLRMGWCVTSGPEARLGGYIQAMHKILRARLCATHPVQFAIAPALRGDHGFLDDTLARISRRRDIAMRELNAIEGISCVAPRGAFYAFPRLDLAALSGGPWADDEAWVKALVRETGVVVVHGGGFGQAPGTAHFRVVILPPEDVLVRAFGLIAKFVG